MLILLFVGLLLGSPALANETSWWVRNPNGKNHFGPYTISELRARVASGRVKKSDHVYSKSIQKWTLVSKLNVLANTNPSSDQSPDDLPETDTAVSKKTESTKIRTYGYLDGMGGLELISGGRQFSLGFRAGGTVYSHGTGDWAIGGYAGYMPYSFASLTVALIPISGEFISRRAFGTGLYGGFNLGVSILQLSGTVSNVSISSSGIAFCYGGAIGYELDVSDHIAVIFDFRYFTAVPATLNWTAASGTTSASGAVELAAYRAFMLHAGIGYRF